MSHDLRLRALRLLNWKSFAAVDAASLERSLSLGENDQRSVVRARGDQSEAP